MVSDFGDCCIVDLSEMKYILLIIFFIFSNAHACEVIDDSGQQIKLARPATRIISLAPDITENLFAIGAGVKLVGVVKGSDYPVQARSIPVIATYDSLDMESLLRLQPDLVIAWADTRFAPQLKKLNIPVYLTHPKHLIDVPQTLRRLGCLTATEKKAETVAADFMRQYHDLQKTYQSKQTISVFFQVWFNPLITITQNSWIDEVIRLCGARNIFSHLKGTAPEVDLEAVLMANPDVIIGTDDSLNWQAHWQKWTKINAVKHQHFISVNADRIERASPRLLEGTKDLCNAIEAVRHRR